MPCGCGMSGAFSRNKGARAERAVAAWLRTHGWAGARRFLAGDGRQPGDIDALPGIALEVKDQATYAIPAWLRQAVDEAGDRLPVVVAKPKGVGYERVGEWWAILRFEDFANLLAERPVFYFSQAERFAEMATELDRLSGVASDAT